MSPPYYMELGPLSLDKIEENLYLGGQGAARNQEVLRKYRITHVLTIDIRPLPQILIEQNRLTTKYLQLLDLPSEDLLSHLDDTYSFIEKGQQHGAVLVHCYFGVSRSASVVIGYLMKKYKIPYEKAHKMVLEKRSIIFPNEGFVSQLKLYKKMGFQVDTNSIHHKLHKLAVAADSVRKIKVLPKEFYKLIKPDPVAEKINLVSNLCRCRRCKRVLAHESNLMLHRDREKICDKCFFFEPIAWMNVHRTDRGRLICPKCSNDIGSFNWIVGSICPCGFHTSPSFCLSPMKVEFNRTISVTSTL